MFFIHQWSQVCFNQLKFAKFNNCLLWRLLNLMLLLWLHICFKQINIFTQASDARASSCRFIFLFSSLPLTSAAFLEPYPKLSRQHRFNCFKPSVNHGELGGGHCIHFRAIILANCFYCVLSNSYNVLIVPILVALGLKFK